MTIIIILGVCLTLILIGWLYGFIKKHFGKNAPPKVKKEKVKKVAQEKSKPAFMHTTYKVSSTFMLRKELLFWKYLNTFLPKEYIVVPKVEIGNLIDVEGDKSTYNRIAQKTIDYVIFNEKTMYPALILDIYDKTYNDLRLEEQDPYITEIINKMGLKFVEILVSSDFDRDKTRELILTKLGLVKQEEEEKNNENKMKVDKL